MTKINLKKVEKNLVVRPLRLSDWENVVTLQKKCFPGKEPFESQLRVFPEGQIGVEYQDKLVASSGSVILDSELYKDWHSRFFTVPRILGASDRIHSLRASSST